MQSFAKYQRWTAFGSREITSLVNFESGISVNGILSNRAQKKKEILDDAIVFNSFLNTICMASCYLQMDFTKVKAQF